MSKKQQYPQTPRTSSQSSSTQKVKVLLRIRPFFSTQDQQEFITLIDNNVISINKLMQPSLMKFHNVQIQKQLNNQKINQDNQIKIYQFVNQSVKVLFQGVDATIFAYGQTGAGKTYTIVGDCPQYGASTDYRPYLTKPCKGIMIRAMQYIITQSRKKRDSRITISFFEIYNQKIYDLLSNIQKALQIRQSRNGQLTIVGLLSVQVTDIKQTINYISQGLKNRITCCTAGNTKSSRSHSIFHIKCQKIKINKNNNNQYQIITSHLRIIDLAGSEKFNIPYDLPQSQKQIRKTQLKSINGSLSKLGHCISALTSQSRTHVPFRDSKLTRILSQSLIGSSQIKLIVCVSPSISAMNETASTLQFADGVKKAIFERPSLPSQRKKMIQYSEYQCVLEQLQQQRNMRQQLQRVLQSMKIPLGELQLTKQNQKLKQQIAILRQQSKSPKIKQKQNYRISSSKSKSNKKSYGSSKSPLSKKKIIKNPISYYAQEKATITKIRDTIISMLQKFS